MVNRNWDILIIGGASGSGKTSISRPLTRHYGIDLVRVDDFQVLLEAMTTSETIPALHYWTKNPNWRSEGVRNAVDKMIDIGRALIPGLAAVINDHISENIPMILEGDFILPEFVASMRNERIKSVFIHEQSKEQIMQNYFQREGKQQTFRAEVSHTYGNWLAGECDIHDIPVLQSRPWDSLLERAFSAIDAM